MRGRRPPQRIPGLRDRCLISIRRTPPPLVPPPHQLYHNPPCEDYVYSWRNKPRCDLNLVPRFSIDYGHGISHEGSLRPHGLPPDYGHSDGVLVHDYNHGHGGEENRRGFGPDQWQGQGLFCGVASSQHREQWSSRESYFRTNGPGRYDRASLPDSRATYDGRSDQYREYGRPKEQQLPWTSGLQPGSSQKNGSFPSLDANMTIRHCAVNRLRETVNNEPLCKRPRKGPTVRHQDQNAIRNHEMVTKSILPATPFRTGKPAKVSQVQLQTETDNQGRAFSVVEGSSVKALPAFISKALPSDTCSTSSSFGAKDDSAPEPLNEGKCVKGVSTVRSQPCNESTSTKVPKVAQTISNTVVKEASAVSTTDRQPSPGISSDNVPLLHTSALDNIMSAYGATSPLGEEQHISSPSPDPEKLPSHLSSSKSRKHSRKVSSGSGSKVTSKITPSTELMVHPSSISSDPKSPVDRFEGKTSLNPSNHLVSGSNIPHNGSEVLLFQDANEIPTSSNHTNSGVSDYETPRNSVSTSGLARNAQGSHFGSVSKSLKIRPRGSECLSSKSRLEESSEVSSSNNNRLSCKSKVSDLNSRQVVVKPSTSRPSGGNDISKTVSSDKIYEKNRKDSLSSPNDISIEESGLLNPKFDTNFRIPKRQPLPNPLLVKPANLSQPPPEPPEKVPSTWLQKPSAKSSGKHGPVQKLLLCRDAPNNGSTGGWRIETSLKKHKTPERTNVAAATDATSFNEKARSRSQSDEQSLMGVLDGRVPFVMAEEVANARTSQLKSTLSKDHNAKHKNIKSTQSINGLRFGKETVEKDPKLITGQIADERIKEQMSREVGVKAKNYEKYDSTKRISKKSNKRSRKDKFESDRKRRKSKERKSKANESDDLEWTPRGTRKSRSRASTPVSNGSCSPVGVASRTRSRTRSRSPTTFTTINNDGFSSRISDSSDDDEDNDGLDKVRDWVSRNATPEENQPSRSCSPAARSTLSQSLKDMQLKKALFARKDNYIALQEWQESNELGCEDDIDRDAATPPLPCRNVESSKDTEQKKQSTPLSSQLLSTGQPQLTLERSCQQRSLQERTSEVLQHGCLQVDVSASSPQRRTSREVNQEEPNPSTQTDLQTPPTGNHSSNPSSTTGSSMENELNNAQQSGDSEQDIELIDLEPNLDLPYVKLLTKLEPKVRHQLDIIFDNLTLAFEDINSYIDKFRLVENLAAFSSKCREHNQLRETFKLNFKQHYVEIQAALLKLIPEHLSRKDLFKILQKRWDSSKDREKKNILTEWEDLNYLYCVADGTPSNARQDNTPSKSNAVIAAGLFKIQKQKQNYMSQPTLNPHPSRSRHRASTFSNVKYERLPPLSRPIKEEQTVPVEPLTEDVAPQIPRISSRENNNISPEPQISSVFN